jgi:hypothetical protein
MMKAKAWVFGTALLLALPALATDSADDKASAQPAAEKEALPAGGEVPAPEGGKVPAPEEQGEAGTTAEGDQAMSAPSGTVARATFTTAIEEHEPVDEIESLGNDQQTVVFFTELRGFEGRTLEHVWERQGEEMARVPFLVGGPRWRVYSRKTLDPGQTGQWTVTVVDESGEELMSETLDYVVAAEMPQDEMLAEEEANGEAQEAGAPEPRKADDAVPAAIPE